MILKACRYFYYRVYIWQLRLYGRSNAPDAAAMGAVLAFSFFNILALGGIIKFFSGFDLIQLYSKYVDEHQFLLVVFAFGIFFLGNKISRKANFTKNSKKNSRMKHPSKD